VQNLDESIKRLRDAGVRFFHEKVQSAGNVRYIAFADPFGNMHELITHTEAPASATQDRSSGRLASSQAFEAADLAWMTGTWVRQQNGDHLEEIWTAPQNGALLGTFRWHRDGKPWMYELMTIQEESGTLMFRLRHFDAALKPWEKETALTYTFERASENEVTS
jgi:hypothetical protein